MLLVNSSVWIDWLRGAATDAVRFVQAREAVEEIALTQMIYLEVLQGVSSDRQFAECQRVLGAQTMLQPLDALETYESAAQLYRKARKKGLTVRKSTDCLIAAIALEQGAMLVHNDRDFLALAQAEPALAIFPSQPFSGHPPTT
jgi:predicted nucleic acid-binding protein